MLNTATDTGVDASHTPHTTGLTSSRRGTAVPTTAAEQLAVATVAAVLLGAPPRGPVAVVHAGEVRVPLARHVVRVAGHLQRQKQQLLVLLLVTMLTCWTY
jgi:hypothetical protein